MLYQLMDAESYRNEHLLIVGGGDSGVEAAIALALQKGNTITISYRKDKFFRIKRRNEERLSKMIENGSIQVIMDSTVKEITNKSAQIETPDGLRNIPNDYTFIFAGGEPPFKLMKSLGIQFGG